MMVDSNSKNNLLENAVDQLNDTDAELLNLLAAEEDCTDILQNIANNEQFEQFINNESEFPTTENMTQNMQDFINQENYDSICGNIEEAKVDATATDDTLDLSEIVFNEIAVGERSPDKSEQHKCEHCDKTYKSKKLLKYHLVTHAGTKPHSCDVCSKTFKHNYEVKLHKRTHEPPSFQCEHCDKLCKSKKLLKYHLMTHTGLRPYSCDICGKSFKHNYEVKVHKRSHNRPTFQCDICSKMFIHKSHLTAHRRKHLGDFVAYCKECNKGFVSESTYKNHVKIQHLKILHICDACGLQMSSLSALNEHKLTHEPNYKDQRSHVCEVCGRSYLNARNLRSHMKSHTQLNNFICNICGKSLSGKKVLETHLKIHTGEKDFVCTYCSKCFSSKEYLRTHERTHTGDRPFKCQICDKSFTQKTSLTIHLRYHSGERPYKCHCGKGFVTKTHLLGHYKTHEVGNIEFSYIPQQI